MTSKRKSRIGEVTCRCRAYKFPHRQLGGRCDGASFVGKFFDAHSFDECKGCQLLDWSSGDARCQALDGIESVMHCEALQEHIQVNEIQLYGENRPKGYRTRHQRRMARRSVASPMFNHRSIP